MELTKGQENALKVAVKRYKDHEAYTVIAGFAGTGKSFLIKHIVDALNLNEDNVVYATFTGKASLVLKQNGCENAMTLHRLLYRCKEKPDGSYEFIPKTALDKQYKLIVVDEVSMVSVEIWDLLMKHKVHVLACGDPEQLPAIDQSCTVLDNPHAFLTEITRQAKESEIIRLSMDVREGKWIDYGGGKDAKIISLEKVSDKLLIGADIILCGKNSTRHSLNEQVRRIKWGEQYQNAPMNGDKAIVLKNYWDLGEMYDEPLINGSIGILQNINLKEIKLYKPEMTASFISDCGIEYNNLKMDYNLFVKKEPTINKDNFMKYPKSTRPRELDFSYAITVHKSQGSSWPRCCIFDEWLGDKDYHRRWLYTAITRSSDKLYIIK